jgi:hypothetical protein
MEVEKHGKRHKWQRSVSAVPEKNRGRTGKRTCKLAEREQNHVTKEAHAGRGQETKQEIAAIP